jgi:hypothetical protein
MAHDLPAGKPAPDAGDIDLRAAADGVIAEPRIAFRIGIGAGSIVLLIAAALLLAAALSRAVAVP